MNHFTPIPGTSLAINWATVDPNCNWVTIDYWGSMEQHYELPSASLDVKYWHSPKCNNIAQLVNYFENWCDMIFERPN